MSKLQKNDGEHLWIKRSLLHASHDLLCKKLLPPYVSGRVYSFDNICLGLYKNTFIVSIEESRLITSLMKDGTVEFFKRAFERRTYHK